MLDQIGTKSEHVRHDDRDRLAPYPFVVVRIACRVCSRRGSYRLARLAAKFGPEISLRDLTDASPHGAGARGDTGAQRLCVRSDARHTFSTVAARGSVWLPSAGGGAAYGPRPSLFLDEPQLHHSGRRVWRPRLFEVRPVYPRPTCPSSTAPRLAKGNRRRNVAEAHADPPGWSCPGLVDGLGLRRVCLGHHVSFRIRWGKDSQGPSGDGTGCRSLRDEL